MTESLLYRPMPSREVVIEDRTHPSYYDLKSRYEALGLRPRTQILPLKTPMLSSIDSKPKIFYNASPKIVSSNGIQQIQFLGRLESLSVEDSVFATAIVEGGMLTSVEAKDSKLTMQKDIKLEDPYQFKLDEIDYTIMVKAWPHPEILGNSIFHSEIAQSDDLEHAIGVTPDFVKGLRVIPAKGLRIDSTNPDSIAEHGYIVYFRPKNDNAILDVDGVSKSVSESEIRRFYVDELSDIQPQRIKQVMQDDASLLLKTKETWGGLGVNLIGKNQEEIVIGHMGISLHNGIAGAREYGVTAFFKDPSNGFTHIQMILEAQDFERNFERETGEQMGAKRSDLKPIVFPTGVIFVKTETGYDTLITAGINDMYQGVAKVDFPFIDLVDFDNKYNQQFVVDESVAREAFPDIYPSDSISKEKNSIMKDSFETFGNLRRRTRTVNMEIQGITGDWFGTFTSSEEEVFAN